MALDLVGYEKKAKDAVRAFWKGRQAAKAKQAESGNADHGERGSVTGGRNMDGFLDLVADIVRANGLPDAEICLERPVLALPGFFRPTKLWDVLVTYKGELIAAVELKSHVGPSFSNNFNNRAEEALGTALDLRTAIREKALGAQPYPFVGWLMLVEDDAKSRSPVKDNSPHFPVFPEFKGASYLARYDILCQKIVREQLYTAAALIASERNAEGTGEFREISTATGLRAFVASLAGHVASQAARLA